MAERADDHVFATLTHLAFSADRSQVRMLQAGHPGLLLRSDDGVRLVEGAAGPAVGLVPSPRWHQTEVPLPAGAGVLLYTDGLFEGRTSTVSGSACQPGCSSSWPWPVPRGPDGPRGPGTLAGADPITGRPGDVQPTATPLTAHQAGDPGWRRRDPVRDRLVPVIFRVIHLAQPGRSR